MKDNLSISRNKQNGILLSTFVQQVIYKKKTKTNTTITLNVVMRDTQLECIGVKTHKSVCSLNSATEDFCHLSCFYTSWKKWALANLKACVSSQHWTADFTNTGSHESWNILEIQVYALNLKAGIKKITKRRRIKLPSH
jgi:hypothetical protein